MCVHMFKWENKEGKVIQHEGYIHRIMHRGPASFTCSYITQTT